MALLIRPDPSRSTSEQDDGLQEVSKLFFDIFRERVCYIDIFFRILFDIALLTALNLEIHFTPTSLI